MIVKPDGEQESNRVTTNENGSVNCYDSNSTRCLSSSCGLWRKCGCETVFAVSAKIAELDNIQPNHELMQQLVAQYKANGTDSVWMSEYDELEPIVYSKAERTVIQRSTTPLAFAPIWFLILVPAVVGAVLIRRRNGGR